MNKTLTLIETEAFLTEADFQEFAKTTGEQLPSDMRAFYTQHNGGKLLNNYFLLKEEPRNIEFFLSIKHGTNTVESNYCEFVRDENIFGINCIPFAMDSGGEYFIYSLEASSYGKIFYFDSDYYDHPEEARELISNTFEELIALLTA